MMNLRENIAITLRFNFDFNTDDFANSNEVGDFIHDELNLILEHFADNIGVDRISVDFWSSQAFENNDKVEKKTQH